MKYPEYRQCPKCRGDELEMQWCSVCNKTGLVALLQSAPQPVAYGIDEEAARRIALAVHDYQNRISDEPLLYAINRILIKEAHPLSAEGLAEVQSAEVNNG